MSEMFCFQCQEAIGGTGCTVKGACGKNSQVAGLQDTLIYATQGLAVLCSELRKERKNVPSAASNKIIENLFITITNANFDAKKIESEITKTIELNQELLKKIDVTDNLPDVALWDGNIISYPGFNDLTDNLSDSKSLRELILFGLKGLAAYTKHAMRLGKTSEDTTEFIEKALVATIDESMTMDELLDMVLLTGEQGVEVMALLDEANTNTYGNPELTHVSLDVKNNPAILISGHDLRDLEMLLEQTQGTGVDVYTHCEMLPANYYPQFKQYDNLVGNYGNAWWKQREEFDAFNGPILMTTNCIVPAKESYIERMYTTGAAGYPCCDHIELNEDGTKDFSSIIQKAKECASPTPIESGELVGGFAHNQVIALAEQVVSAVNSGDISKFVVMAGCDGRMNSRSYYTDFAEELPNDTVILTAGCAKYRYNKLNLGDINGIPRVLDAGQCNDSYSLVVIAQTLQKVFELDDINDLPIIYNIAWYEQKAVIVLLALLSLGVKNIHLGPTLPAFLSPNVVNVLVEQFGIQGIQTVQEDLELFFA